MKWIPTSERLPTEEEHATGCVCVWAYEGEKPQDWDVETYCWKPHAWGKVGRMPDYWCLTKDFDWPAQAG